MKREVKYVNWDITILGTKTTSRIQPSVSKVDGTRKSFELDTAMACADQKIAYLSKEINKLKEEQLTLVQSNELIKNQVSEIF